MNRETTMDVTRLAAFADGELTPEDAAAVVLHLADHPQDQAYVDDLMASNAALARAFGGVIDDPVPPAILATIRGEALPKATVLPFRKRPATLWGGGVALAASVVLAALLLPRDPGALVLAAGPVAPDSALDGHLRDLPSGLPVTLPGGGTLVVLASMPVAGGHCREAEVIDPAGGHLTVALACSQGAGWTVQVALSEPIPVQQEAGDFVPAGGIETQAMDMWLDRLGAGAALSPADEAALISGGWRP